MSPKRAALPEAAPLPRGRHRLTPEQVRASQRERILAAMVALVGERGYAATSVPEVVAAARVSRNAFYDLFADKEDCFIAACDEQARELTALMLSFASAPTWRAAVEEGMHAYLGWWSQRPAYTRAYLVELPSAGSRAIEQRDRAYEPFRAMFAALGARARAEEPALPPLHPLAPRLVVAGVTELIAEEVRAGRGERLGGLHDELVTLIQTVLASRV